MSHRWILVELRDGRRIFHSLESDVLVVGSSAEADVLLDHPTVSRRHAELKIADNDLYIVDLGSSNGTFIAGSRIRGSEILRAETAVQFGSLSCIVERVAAEETEAAVRLDLGGPTAGPEPAGPALAPETLSLGSLREFMTGSLPEVVRSLEEYFRGPPDQRPAGAIRVVQSAGRALFLSFPFRCLEILRETSGEESSASALLFRAFAEDFEPEEQDAWSETQAGALVIRMLFSPGLHPRGVEPLVELVGRLAALTMAEEGSETRPRRCESAPPLPAPATLDPGMLRLYDEASRVARGEVSVLIRGETGTGKEVLARYIHEASSRRQMPWVAINCAALPEDLLEAELFGIEKGVATGVDARAGTFEQADGGTLFLDEIGDMALATQAKILRVLQEGRVYRLGAKTARPARARIIAATNQDVKEKIAEGSFRLDLYHRIADCQLVLPALRERLADLPSLAAHFLAQAAAESDRRPQGISRAALDAMAAYPWPGNIRQLEREMTRAALFVEDGQLLQSRHLQADVVARGDGASSATDGDRVPAKGPLKARLDEVERKILIDVLAAHDGNVRAAASELGIGRTTLYRRLGDLSIEI